MESEFETLKVTKQKEQCGRFPKLTDLNVMDTYWHVKNSTNGTFYLFNAYFDDREEKLRNRSAIRIVAFIDKIDPIVKTYCQLWFDGIAEIITSEVYEYRLIWLRAWDSNDEGASPYLISCENPLSSEGLVPSHVSLVEEKCEESNNVFEVKNKRPKNGRKKQFLVSVKGFEFADDISLWIIE